MSEKRGTVRQQKKPAVIYLGPAIPGTVSAGIVFKNGLTAQMEKAVKEEPALKMLLVKFKQRCRLWNLENRQLNWAQISWLSMMMQQGHLK